MPELLRNPYKRCFISAPFGLDLGVLPRVLGNRGISWEWTKEQTLGSQDSRLGIAAADFVLVIMNGTKGDYRGAFDVGIAVGLLKPILLIQVKGRALPLDYRRFTTVKISLLNEDALNFHLELFLASPPVLPQAAEVELPRQEQFSSTLREHRSHYSGNSDLERRIYNSVIAAGGTAIPQPNIDSKSKFRPDFLVWLGKLDSEFLDPVVVEVKRTVFDGSSARKLEEQLLNFMQTARFGMALVLTATPPPERQQQLSPNVLWLTIDEFEKLLGSEQLGSYVRDTRNRITHGSR